MPKSDEEYQSEIDELKAKIEGLADSKKTILDEKKKLEKKYKESDSDEYFKLRDDYEKLEGENRKLEKSNNVLSKDLEKSVNSIAEKDKNLSKLLVDDFGVKGIGLLNKHKAIDIEEAVAYAKREGKPQLVDGVAMVGDKTYGDWIKEDLPNLPKSHMYLKANENSGGGAGGGSGGGSNAVGKIDGTKSEQEAYIANKFNINKE